MTLPVTDKPHLSTTQLGMLARCGTQYELRYVRGIKVPPGVQGVIGRGVHSAVQTDLVSKQEWGELLPDDAVADCAADAARRAWQEEEPIRSEGDPDQGGALDTTVSLAQLHHREVAPRIEPVAVERGFLLELPGFAFNVMGFVDVEEAGTIRDLKTAARAPKRDAADLSDQLTLYHLDATVRGQPGKAVALDYLVKTAEPKVVTLTSTRGPEDHARLLLRIEAAARVIQAGNFAPTAPDNPLCSLKFCGYYANHCPYGARGKVSVGLIDPSKLSSRLTERKAA